MQNPYWLSKFSLKYIHTCIPIGGGLGSRHEFQISPFVLARYTFSLNASVVGGRLANLGAFDSFPLALFIQALYLKRNNDV